ncbi:MAG: alpha/beta fold hydrolase [Pseudomonadota bacterium]
MRADIAGTDPQIQLEYELSGPAAGEVVVFIRGLGTQMIEWPEEFLQSFHAQGLRTLIFDNRDVGLSTKCEDEYSLKDMAGDVIGLLDHLTLSRAVIFGISLGGMVAQLVAYHYPERVRALFSVMSGSGNPDVPTVSADMLPHLTRSAEGRDNVIRLSADNKVLFGSPGYPEDESERLAQARAAYDRCYFPAGVARQMRAANRDGSRVDRLRKIDVPTLVIHGADDALVNPAAGRDTADNIPGARFELVPGMGHNIPRSLAPRLAEVVLDFLKNL